MGERLFMSEVVVQQVLDSVFSDETRTFRTPEEPDVGDSVTIRLRIRKNTGASVTLLKGFPALQMPMQKLDRGDAFDWFETSFVCEDKTMIFYSFLVEAEGKKILYDRVGTHFVDAVPSTDSRHAFQIYPGFHVPAWSKGAVQYQILVDRFYNGNWSNDVQEREYRYTNWFARPDSLLSKKLLLRSGRQRPLSPELRTSFPPTTPIRTLMYGFAPTTPPLLVLRTLWQQTTTANTRSSLVRTATKRIQRT